jgi:sugar (pentulose or hexulose) kinase
MDGLFYHAGGMSDCMGALEFVRQGFTPFSTAQEFERAAANTAIGADGVLFYPYLSGGRAPFWDATLTAEMRGLTRAHTANHAARATYEGVGHVMTAIWHDMAAKLGQRPPLLHVLGGGGQSDFFCQMLADMLNVEIKRGGETDCAFATALFAAAAHMGTDLRDMARQVYQSHGVFTPDKKAHADYASLYIKFMARHLPA